MKKMTMIKGGFVGPPCPSCKQPTQFMGVEESRLSMEKVEVYHCIREGHRIEGPIVQNEHDNDYPPDNTFKIV